MDMAREEALAKSLMLIQAGSLNRGVRNVGTKSCISRG